MNALEKEIAKAASPLQREKTGKNFQALSLRLQNSIDENLIITEDMRRGLLENCKISSEWTTALRGEKRKVITEYVDGKIRYTVKNKNKILLRTNSKEATANKIAEFYNSLM